jgi:hypothetical protein
MKKAAAFATAKNNCGLLIFLGGSPKPRQDVNQQHRYDCSSTAYQALTPFPQKE